MIRVLITDDSLFMRASVKKILERDGRFEIIGEAKNGREAVDKVAQLKPDVCTMDFNMPVLDGAGAVREIMRTKPTPVVMLSAYTREGARETFEALAAGAVDFVTKPSGEVSAELMNVAPQLVAKLVAAVEARPMAMPSSAPEKPKPRISGVHTQPVFAAGPKIALVAVSTGGPAALGRFLPNFPADTSVALVVVQHLPAAFTGPLAERLDNISAIRVREAAEGDTPEEGCALIAPGDRHLEFTDAGAIRLTDGPELHGVRPAADITMRSAARVFGRRCIGVVMTGMGKDGTDGLKAIKAAGGPTFAQDQQSCVIYGMPRSAVEAGTVDKVVPLDDLASAVRRF
jgi:two-component system chemotaxis response regulator CheB